MPTGIGDPTTHVASLASARKAKRDRIRLDNRAQFRIETLRQSVAAVLDVLPADDSRRSAVLDARDALDHGAAS